jgi:hypothetical protein
MGGACSMNKRDGNIYKILTGKREGKRPLVNQGLDERIILELISGRSRGSSVV